VGDRTAIESVGGELVVFYNAEVGLIESWRGKGADLPGDLTVLADPSAGVYKALGTTRQSYAKLLTNSVGGAVRSAREGRLPRLTSADMQRLGADAAVRADGEIAKLHLASSPDDRLPLSALVAAFGGV
jgi:hypothetical protein